VMINLASMVGSELTVEREGMKRAASRGKTAARLAASGYYSWQKMRSQHSAPKRVATVSEARVHGELIALASLFGQPIIVDSSQTGEPGGFLQAKGGLDRSKPLCATVAAMTARSSKL
jgi:hypothetical protein